MTDPTTESRDAVARAIGYEKSHKGYWRKGNGYVQDPCPATLDAAHENFPPGWKWLRKFRGDGQIIWIGLFGMQGYGGKDRSVADTGVPMHDLWRLCAACWAACGEKP